MSWTRKFVVSNLELILSEKDRRDSIKLRKKDFFHKKGLKSSESFTLKELAHETIKYFISTNRIRSEEDLRKFVESAPFLSDYVTQNQIEALIGLIKPTKLAILTREDLGKLGREQYRMKKEQEFLKAARMVAEEELEEKRRKAMEEVKQERVHLEQLREAVEEKMDEVKRMESILDDLPSEIDPQDYISPEVETRKERKRPRMWWDRIGLNGDPFPTKLGLNRIPENKYEEVIVKTTIFDEYVKMIEEASQTLFGKTILTAGQFGSGKTTFIQYISYKLAQHTIIPFQLVLDPVGETDILRQNFYSDIFNLICKSMKQRGLPDPRPQGAPLDKGVITELLSCLARESQIRGYVIMIDGLHKAESTLDASLEFVKQLQNFHEHLNNYDVNVCIFVTISPLWLRRITQNPAYSGSFYRIDEMPRLTFELAYELLIKRFRAFASPDIPIFFDKSTVRFAYDCVSGDFGQGITFRSFIDFILPRLERGDHKEVGVSVAVDLEDVLRIEGEFQESALMDSYSYFRSATKTKPALRRACAKILKIIYRRTYLDEQSRDFLSNRGAFYTLRNSRMIQKMKTRRGLGWTLTSEFLAFLEDLNEQGYPPAVVFQSFSIDPTITRKREKQDEPLLNLARNFLVNWESEWPEIVPSLNSFLEKQEKIAERCISGVKADICIECQSALLNLIQCGQIIFSNKQSPEEWLRSIWLDIPVVPTIVSVLQQESVLETDAIEYYQRYHQSATVILEKLVELLEINRITNILTSQNGREETISLFKAGNFLRTGDLAKAIEEINAIIEKQIRVTFHLAFSLHFGVNYLKKLPLYVQERISNLEKKGSFPIKRSVDQNLFYHFSRSEYAEVVNNKHIWSTIFEKVFHPRSREDVVNTLRITFALDDRKQHRDRVDYFRRSREQIRDAINNADWILESIAKIIHLSMEPAGFTEEIQDEHHEVRFSFIDQDHCASSFPWRIQASKKSEIARRLTKTSRIIDFSNDLAVSTLFNGSLAEIFIVISLLLKNKLIDIQSLTEGNMHFRVVPSEHTPSM